MHTIQADPVDSRPAASVADAWLQAVTHRDHRVAWSLIDPDLRRAYAQDWIVQTLGRTPDSALAERLAVAESDEPAWVACARANGEIWHLAHKWWEVCGWRAQFVSETGSLGSLARVAFAINQDRDATAAGDELPLQHFLMRRRDTWRIAGIGQFIAWTSWPPPPPPP